MSNWTGLSGRAYVCESWVPKKLENSGSSGYQGISKKILNDKRNDEKKGLISQEKMNDSPRPFLIACCLGSPVKSGSLSYCGFYSSGALGFP